MELDPVTGGVINIFNSPSQPIVGPSAGLAFDGEFLYLTHQQEGTKLLKLNPDSGVVEGSFTMGAGLSSPGLAFLGGKLYATRSFGKIEVYDPLSGSLLDTLDFFEANPDIDKSPIGLAALSDPNGPDRLVTILGSGSDVEIAELNPNSAVVESSFALPEADGEKSPLGLAVVGESIYVGLHLATLEPGTGFVRQGLIYNRVGTEIGTIDLPEYSVLAIDALAGDSGAIPEPSSVVLYGACLLLVCMLARKRLTQEVS